MEFNRDTGLYFRMIGVLGGLGLLYIVFIGALSYFLNPIAVFIIAAIFLFCQYFFSDKLALRSANATKVSEEEYPELHQTVTKLSQQADIPKPDVAVTSSIPMPNAFATGRSVDSSVVCVTEELLAELDDDEVEAVLAHELSHIKNRDVLVMTIASFFSTVAFMFVRFGIYTDGDNQGVIAAILVSLVVWVISFFLIRMLSRYREFSADRGAAAITGDPLALASALQTIEGSPKPDEDLREHIGSNAFYIAHIDADSYLDFISTHPSTERRVKQLQEIAKSQEKRY